MPSATKRLAFFENIDETGESRVFHFFTIEAKKTNTSADDTVGKRQSLNNASQALHNMFEFLREAGPEHKKIFFTKVRFFSVVASTEGLTVRIHRATEEPEDGSERGLIIPNRPDYPLRFEYREFARIQKDAFERETAFEIFKKILLGYAVKTLRPLLESAAKNIMKKLDRDPAEFSKRANADFYRYGQTIVTPGSRRETLAPSYAQSASSRMSFDPRQISTLRALGNGDSPTNESINMLQSEIATPTQIKPLASLESLNSSGKRRRSPLEKSVPTQNNPKRRR